MLLERFTRDNEKAVPSTDIIVRKQGPSFEDLLEKTESRFEHIFYFSPYSREEAQKLWQEAKELNLIFNAITKKLRS